MFPINPLLKLTLFSPPQREQEDTHAILKNKVAALLDYAPKAWLGTSVKYVES